MDIFRSIDELGGVTGPVVLAVGVFDGMHRGHQAVLGAALSAAREVRGSAVALTFDPHPARILRPEAAPRLLTSTRHKLRLMEEAGFSHVLVLGFDEAFAAVRAEDFVTHLSRACRPLARICVGEGWLFGHKRLGNGALLRTLGGTLGFATTEVAPVLADGRPVSSTVIRAAIASGDLAGAARLLGRDYSILGTVRRGEGIGRQLGFPTANLAAHNEQFPPDGVYAVRVRMDGTDHPGVANIGTRPTVTSAGERLLEVHVLDFSADLYERDIETLFVAYLRGEQKFASLDALRDQIARDSASARDFLR